MENVIDAELLSELIAATPERRAAARQVLKHNQQAPTITAQGPLLLNMGESAKFGGFSRSTLWRLIKAGKIATVEILPGLHRIRRIDLERLAGVVK